MKKIIFMLAFVLLAFAGQSQTAPTAESRAKAMTTGMVQNLRLTPAQTAKIQEINLSSIQQVEQAKVKYKAAPLKLKAEMDQIGRTRLTLIKETLTPQQFDQFQMMREKKMGISRDGSQPGGNAALNEYNN